MESSQTITCIACMQVLEPKMKRYSLSTKVDKHDFPVFEALSETLKVAVPLTPLQSDTRRRVMCAACASPLCTSYKRFQLFRARIHPDSYLYNKINLPIPPMDMEIPEELEVSIESENADISNCTISTNALTPVLKRLMKYNRNKGNKATVTNFVRRIINMEVKTLKSGSKFSGNEMLKGNWLFAKEELHEEIKLLAPFLYKVLNGACSKNQKNMCFNEAMQTIVGIILFARNQKCNFLQKLVGFILFKGRAPIKVFTLLRKMKICCSARTIENSLDKMNLKFDSEIKLYKKDTTDKLKRWQVSQEKVHLSSEEDLRSHDLTSQPETHAPKFHKGEGGSRTAKCSKKMDFRVVELESELMTASFSIDNINHVPNPGNFSSNVKVKPLNMTSANFVFNRVPISIQDALKDPMTKKATDIKEEAFIPTAEDVALFRRDHLVMIKRILVKNFAMFNKVSNKILWSIPHKYEKFTKQKSKVISLGILDIDEGTTAGTVKILEFIDDYLPRKPDGTKLTCAVGSDTLTADFIRSTQNHRCNSQLENEQLQNCTPSVGQLHLKFALLDDIMNLLFGKKGKDGQDLPCPDVGSLPMLRARFGHPSKLRNVKQNYILAVRFMRFSLNVYICTLACQILGIKCLEIETIPMSYATMDKKEMEALLQSTAEKVLNFEFIDTTRNTSMTKFCFCKTDYDSSKEYIACDNDNCLVFWFHTECLLAQNGEHVYRKPPKKKDDEYFCSNICQHDWKDKKTLYSKTLTNAMLNFECYNDAIRRGDGDRMDSWNKSHLIQMHNRNHRNIFRVLHYFQLNKYGFADGNIAHDLKHNSTINISGQPDGNLDIDLYHEMVNDYLKESILLPCGNLTKASIQRRSRSFQILGDISNEVTEYYKKFDDNFDPVQDDRKEKKLKHNKKHTKYLEDLKQAMLLIEKEDLFINKGVRFHKGFEKFRNNLLFLENITEYKAKLTRQSRLLDDVKRYQVEEKEALKESSEGLHLPNFNDLIADSEEGENLEDLVNPGYNEENAMNQPSENAILETDLLSNLENDIEVESESDSESPPESESSPNESE